MSSQKEIKLVDLKDDLAVRGYIRRNFDKKCWIDEIMATIIQFYLRGGGVLYVCGNAGSGKLGGWGQCKELTLCPPFINDNAFKVSVSTNHTLILDTKGDVWCCGDGTDGQLGNGKTNNLYKPTKLNLAMRVIAVCAGKYHSLLLCVDGTVKGCGSNEYGQIGIGDLEKTFVPTTIEKLKKYKVFQISAGRAHSAALTEGGELFCFGADFYGQCGVGKYKGTKIKIPTKVDLDDEIEFVDCGSYHTLITSWDGLMYSFGAGLFGKLGHGGDDNKHRPTLIEAVKEQKMKMCAAGYAHSLCIDREGIIWSFGDNEEGQCGLSEDIYEQRIPHMISWFVENGIKAKQCVAGTYSSSVISFDGSLYVFGSNSHYQLGLSNCRNRYIPIRCLPRNVCAQSVAMGYNHTAIVCNEPQ